MVLFSIFHYFSFYFILLFLDYINFSLYTNKRINIIHLYIMNNKYYSLYINVYITNNNYFVAYLLLLLLLLFLIISINGYFFYHIYILFVCSFL